MKAKNISKFNKVHEKYKFKILIISLFSLLNLEKIKKNIPYISIFIPIYNKQDYIGKTIILLLNQTLKNIEIIAINDYSSDKSYEILKAYSLKDKRIIIINNTKKFWSFIFKGNGNYSFNWRIFD